MDRPLDLNQLRQEILENQRRAAPLPAEPEAKVFVDRNGKIVRGTEAPTQDSLALSEIHQGVFASGARALDEELVATTRMPAGTRRRRVDGIDGWLYEIISELGDPFQMFAYWDGTQYQVKVVYPDLEGRYDPHHGHLYTDGRICLRSGGGMPDLAGAYAKSVLWATGFGAFIRTGQFPFNG